MRCLYFINNVIVSISDFMCQEIIVHLIKSHRMLSISKYMEYLRENKLGILLIVKSNFDLFSIIIDFKCWSQEQYRVSTLWRVSRLHISCLFFYSAECFALKTIGYQLRLPFFSSLLFFLIRTCYYSYLILFFWSQFSSVTFSFPLVRQQKWRCIMRSHF